MSSSSASAQSSATPILDRILPVPASAKSNFWLQIPDYILSIAIFWVLPLLLISGRGRFLDPVRHWLAINIREVFSSNEWAGVRVILTGFAMAFAFLAAVAVHELAHLVTGWAMGFHFQHIQIGRTHIDRFLHVSRKPAPDEPRLGQVHFLPEQMKQRPWRCALMILAGPVANLLAGIVVLSLPFEKSFISGAFVLTCFYLGITNLSPQASDGSALLTILLKRKDHEARIALTQLFEQVSAGAEYQDLSPALIAEATALREKSVRTVFAHLVAYARYSEERDYNSAAASLEECFTWSPWAPVNFRRSLFYSAAVLQAKRGQIALAEQWYSDLPPQISSRFRFQAQAAILGAQGDYARALTKIAECEKQLLDDTDASKKESAMRDLKKWKSELEERVSATPLQQA